MKLPFEPLLRSPLYYQSKGPYAKRILFIQNKGLQIRLSLLGCEIMRDTYPYGRTSPAVFSKRDLYGSVYGDLRE